jgi:hypothetical protein
MAVVTIAPKAPVELVRQVLPLPKKVDNFAMAGVAKTVTVPAKTLFALIKVTADMNINSNATATDPAADTMDGSNDGSASWVIQASDGPQLFNVGGVATFSVFGTGKFRVSWYGDQGVL